MLDGIYQSVIAFYIPYLAISGSYFVSMNGLDVTDRVRLGAYVAHPAIITINMYILMNTYRWDWIMLLVVVLSDLFIFFWTGVYTSFTSSTFMYHAAAEIYGQLSFWLVFLITPCVCLLPRFVVKSVQKVYFPYDVDIIREQITMGKFKKIEEAAAAARNGIFEPDVRATDSVSSDSSARKPKHAKFASVDEDRRPIYPPSVATHTQNGSDGTNYTNHDRHLSRELTQEMSHEIGPVRPSIDRPRPSYDRIRASMDRVRPSFEASNDFTSAARLSRIESSHSASRHGHAQSHSQSFQHGSPTQRRFNLHTVRQRGLSVFSKKSIDTNP
jgi:phospholipid-translocating ATPase